MTHSSKPAAGREIPVLVTGEKQLGESKIARSPVQFADAPVLRKPSWIRVRLPAGNAVQHLKQRLRANALVTVCEEASCPNIHECFNHGTATFMILGEVCTRRCSFSDVAHGRPKPPDADEPRKLANKTWEGFIGGIISTTIIGYFLGLLTPLNDYQVLLVSFAMGVSGFAGDIVISSVKRDIGIKDMGTSIPGHGGVLDRIDSLAYTTPVFFHLVYYMAY